MKHRILGLFVVVAMLTALVAGCAAPAAPVKVSIGSAGGFSTGQRVRHSYFGDGVITDVTDTSDDKQISVLFDAAEERTFLLSLIADKLEAIVD